MATIAEALGGSSLNIAEAIKDFNPGGGSGGDSNIFIVSFLTESTIDKTYEEIYESHQAGKIIIFSYYSMSAFATYATSGGDERFEGNVFVVDNYEDGGFGDRLAYQLIVRSYGVQVRYGSF